MIQYTQGNLLDANTEALVNTVNEVGVMGKGIALMFRDAYPENNRLYESACKAHQVQVGKMFVVKEADLFGKRWIINFPTKKHWRHPSKMDWITEGLKDLAKVIRQKAIRSIAIPPLGCGNGGLEWAQVKREIELALGELVDVQIIVYAPTLEYQNAPKRAGVEELTPSRALIAEMVRRYSILGLDCTNLEVQKLGWFLSRVTAKLGIDDPLKLNYIANKYGPYADNLRHLLDGLDGSYLHCEKRLSDAGPKDIVRFDDSRKEQVVSYLADPSMSRFAYLLEQTSELIDGFESPLGMELLATVDWLLSGTSSEMSINTVRSMLAAWPGEGSAATRKLKLFDERLIGLAVDRLKNSLLYGDLAQRK
jgi:O-acetyl-ADP-ribose deacetylase (regulator of RNase III)